LLYRARAEFGLRRLSFWRLRVPASITTRRIRILFITEDLLFHRVWEVTRTVVAPLLSVVGCGVGGFVRVVVVFGVVLVVLLCV